jgi:hypothetical protein
LETGEGRPKEEVREGSWKGRIATFFSWSYLGERLGLQGEIRDGEVAWRVPPPILLSRNQTNGCRIPAQATLPKLLPSLSVSSLSQLTDKTHVLSPESFAWAPVI